MDRVWVTTWQIQSSAGSKEGLSICLEMGRCWLMKGDNKIFRRGYEILNINVQNSLWFMRSGYGCQSAGEKEVRGRSGGFCRSIKVIVYLPLIYLSLPSMRCCKDLERTRLAMFHNSFISNTLEVWKKTVWPAPKCLLLIVLLSFSFSLKTQTEWQNKNE